MDKKKSIIDYKFWDLNVHGNCKLIHLTIDNMIIIIYLINSTNYKFIILKN